MNFFLRRRVREGGISYWLDEMALYGGYVTTNNCIDIE